MPILGITASSIFKSSTSFESIATVTVGSGGAADVTFSSIPSDYTHLQVRGISRVGAVREFWIRVNSDTGTNYSYHTLLGNGTSASGGAVSSTTRIATLATAGSATAADTFSPVIIDVLDYKNTNKYKTLRILSGTEQNTSTCEVGIGSGLWQSTAAITSITLLNSSGSSFAQYSHFALYGIRSAQ